MEALCTRSLRSSQFEFHLGQFFCVRYFPSQFRHLPEKAFILLRERSVFWFDEVFCKLTPNWNLEHMSAVFAVFAECYPKFNFIIFENSTKFSLVALPIQSFRAEFDEFITNVYFRKFLRFLEKKGNFSRCTVTCQILLYLSVQSVWNLMFSTTFLKFESFHVRNVFLVL